MHGNMRDTEEHSFERRMITMRAVRCQKDREKSSEFSIYHLLKKEKNGNSMLTQS